MSLNVYALMHLKSIIIAWRLINLIDLGVWILISKLKYFRGISSRNFKRKSERKAWSKQKLGIKQKEYIQRHI